MRTLLLILLLMSNTIVFADSIPGYAIFKVSGAQYKSSLLLDRTDIYTTYMGIEYGVFRGSIISPYVFGSMENYYQTEDFQHNYPFSENYTVGAGVRIMNIFFIRYTHQCEHYVHSTENQYTVTDKYHSVRRDRKNKYDLYVFPRETYRRIEIGIEITID